eukprot:5711483-Ditylum_brightwellii.AAC.1
MKRIGSRDNDKEQFPKRDRIKRVVSLEEQHGQRQSATDSPCFGKGVGGEKVEENSIGSDQHFDQWSYTCNYNITIIDSSWDK